MTDTVASKCIERYEALKTEKQPWMPMYQRLAEYVFQRAANFTRKTTSGQFLNGYIFDDTAPWAAHVAAGLLKANLFPSARRAVKIKPSDNIDPELLKQDEIKDWFDHVNKAVIKAMSHARSGLDMALDEYMLDNIVFGTSGIGTWEQPEGAQTDVYYTAINTVSIMIDEGADGFVDTVYMEKCMTVKQVVQRFGIENVSKDTRSRYDKNQLQHEVRVLHAIEPRMLRKWSFGDLDMPVASCHIEIEAKHILQESGYDSLPVSVGRFYKAGAMNETYGRSPAMDCMPSILEINHARECIIRAGSKTLRPPLSVVEDGLSTHGKIDLSDGGINIKKLNGRIESGNFEWIKPLFTVGDMKPVKERIQEIVEQIIRHFFLDRLLDFNSDQRMTLGEVNIRERRTGQSLNPIFVRQTAEVFTPTVERTVNILQKRRRFGYIPNSPELVAAQEIHGPGVRVIPPAIWEYMKRGEDIYEIEYISPASRMERSEILLGLQQLTAMLVEMAKSGMPQAANGLQWYTFLKTVCELTGTPMEVLLSENDAKEAEQQANQAAAAQAQANLEHIQSQANRANAQADAERAKAGSATAQENFGVEQTIPGTLPAGVI